MNAITVTKVNGPVRHDFPQQGHFVIRGRNKGSNAKPGVCMACGDVIAIGEQYIVIEDCYKYCLGCVEYE